METPATHRLEAQELSPEERRIIALQCASATYQSAQGLGSAQTREVLARAKMFEAYLKGD